MTIKTYQEIINDYASEFYENNGYPLSRYDIVHCLVYVFNYEINMDLIDYIDDLASDGVIRY